MFFFVFFLGGGGAGGWIFQHFTNVWGCKFDLAVKWSTYDHHLNKLGRDFVSTLYIPRLGAKLSWFQGSS